MLNLYNLIKKADFFYKSAQAVGDSDVIEELKKAISEVSDGTSEEELAIILAIYVKAYELNDGFNALSSQIRRFKNSLNVDEGEEDQAIDNLLNRVLFDIKPKLQLKSKDSNQAIAELRDVATRARNSVLDQDNEEDDVETSTDEDDSTEIDEKDLSGEDMSLPEADEAGPRNKNKSIFQRMEGQSGEDGKGNAGYFVGELYDPKDYAKAIDLDISQYTQQLQTEPTALNRVRIKEVITELLKLQDLYLKKMQMVEAGALTGNPLIDSEISKVNKQIRDLNDYIKDPTFKRYDPKTKTNEIIPISKKDLNKVIEDLKNIKIKRKELLSNSLETSPYQILEALIQDQRKKVASAKAKIRNRDIELETQELKNKLLNTNDRIQKLLIEQEIEYNNHRVNLDINKREEGLIRRQFISRLKNDKNPISDDEIKYFIDAIRETSAKKIPRAVKNVQYAAIKREKINSKDLEGLLIEAKGKLATSKTVLKQTITDNIRRDILSSKEEEFRPIIDKIAKAKLSRNELEKKAAFAELSQAINIKKINAEAELHPLVVNHVKNVISKFNLFFKEIKSLVDGSIDINDNEKVSQLIKDANQLHLQYIGKQFMGAAAAAVADIATYLKNRGSNETS